MKPFSFKTGIALPLLASAGLLRAQTIQTLHSFNGANGDGVYPEAGLTQGNDGEFYSTTIWGGIYGTNSPFGYTSGYGTVFRVDGNGVLTTLASFDGTNGDAPFGGLALGNDGNFYGTTSFAGANNYGTVFRLDSNGLMTTMVSFASTNGRFPFDGLVQGTDGNFYGTTVDGGTAAQDDGSAGYGTIFRISTNGVLTSLYSFTGADDGWYPNAGLTLGKDGNFYGTTAAGGTYDSGTVFRMDTNGVLTTLVSFSGTNGLGPFGSLVQGSDGRFYGSTVQGGNYNNGTVFRIDTNGVLTNLYSFTGGSDGWNPYGALVEGPDGQFYGTTYFGGSNDTASTFGYGTVFRLNPNGVLTTLASFNIANGAYPYGGLTLGMDGNFYGTTEQGGITNLTTVQSGQTNRVYPSGMGTVFRLNLPPAIIEPFSGATVYWGTNADLSVQAWGTGPLSYQWFYNGAAVSGGTNSTLTLTSIQFTNAGLYSVVVSSPFGSVTNSPAQVAVNPAGLSLGLYAGVTISGVVGNNYIIQRTPNLGDPNSWVTLTNVTLTQPVQIWVDTTVNTSLPVNSHNFYRLLPAQ